MLQSIGDRLKGHKWLAYLLLGPLALIFAAWGAYGIVNLSVGSTSYAAEANGSKISLEEARNAWLREQSQWQQRLGGTELPLQLRDELQNQVLEGLIRSALLAQRTQDLGYRVSHDELLDAIHSEACIPGRRSVLRGCGQSGARPGGHLARSVPERDAQRPAPLAAGEWHSRH